MHKSKRAEHALCVAVKDIEILTAVRNSKNVRACIFRSLFFICPPVFFSPRLAQLKTWIYKDIVKFSSLLSSSKQKCAVRYRPSVYSLEVRFGV